MPQDTLMENAGRGAFEVMRRRGGLGRVLVACGKGNNAGDGYVIIGFGGRLLGEGTPKYLNSPETELFDKGRSLFNHGPARDLGPPVTYVGM